MVEPIGVGVIGAGGIAQAGHIPAFQKQPGVKVVAISDPNGEKRKAVAAKFDIPHDYEDYQSLVARDDIAIVSVCSPNFLHHEHAVAALRAGKHVLCEKPVAMSSAEAGEILDQARAAGTRFMVAFPHRFRPASVFLKQLISRGELGEVYYARISCLRRRGIPGLGGWFTTKKMSGGGPLIDIGVHIIDKACWLMGASRPVAVSGVTFQKFRDQAVDGGWPPAASRVGDRYGDTFDVEDLASAFVRFENGAAMAVEASWAGNSEKGMSFHFFGTRAGAREDGSGLTVFGESGGVLTDTVPQLKPAENMFEAEIAHFVDCVRRDRPVLTTPEEVLAVARIIEGIYRSAESGRECRL